MKRGEGEKEKVQGGAEDGCMLHMYEESMIKTTKHRLKRGRGREAKRRG
jgi:hypothetical protein